MDLVPEEVVDRELVDRELASVEQAVELDGTEVGFAKLTELLGPVLLDVPRVLRLLSALGCQGEEVGSRNEHDRVLRADHVRLTALEDRVRVLDVLDRLQEDDRVDLACVVLDQLSLKRDVGLRVPQARVLEGFGIRVDPDDRLSGARQHLGAVTLTTR